MSLAPSPGYSAAVAIRLEFDGLVAAVAQVGETSLILAEPVDIPTATTARLVVTVDDEEFPYDICICTVQGKRVSFT